MRDPILTPTFFERNREKFIARMEEQSIAVFHAATPVVNSVDQFHQFRQSSDFFYFTGLEKPGCILMMHPEDAKGKTTTLFIPQPDPSKEVWEGTMLDKETAEEISGIDAKYIQWEKSFEDTFIHAQRDREVLYADYDDLGFKYGTSKNVAFVGKVRKSLPALDIVKVGKITHDLRRIKQPEEIQLIEQAIEITGKALEAIWKRLSPGVMEYELEAELAYHCIANNARRYAYEPIIASGINAATLHYIDNSKQVNDGELLLTDVGAEYSHYCADITRTVPVNGTFTDRQREIYEAVLSVEKTIIESVKPGVKMKELNAEAKDMLGDRLMDLELIGDKEETGKYYMHSIGHFLGLDTHDVGSTKPPLEPGNILTIEPGIYVQEEQLGVRIEDDVLVTEDGCRVLSEDIPKDVEAVESQAG
ncbi:MAG: aminopeptidase P family protein [Candidatus Marinimicrobia bacterium]|nr:aminopeptidase P family protein [Candidatus Neomarinimicrobiota bacterium]MCF7828509.1 aminopeptidase P family protein [Candidatus Neomarinimicrobiota bacterium]MCF7882068.1 aminopeptidase P family protein [Candidatus Neomarinimicrobiota bacterium]